MEIFTDNLEAANRAHVIVGKFCVDKVLFITRQRAPALQDTHACSFWTRHARRSGYEG